MENSDNDYVDFFVFEKAKVSGSKLSANPVLKDLGFLACRTVKGLKGSVGHTGHSIWPRIGALGRLLLLLLLL